MINKSKKLQNKIRNIKREIKDGSSYMKDSLFDMIKIRREIFEEIPQNKFAQKNYELTSLLLEVLDIPEQEFEEWYKLQKKSDDERAE